MIYSMFLHKKRLIRVLVCVMPAMPYGLLAQEKPLPDFNSVRTPNSPAFSILGIQPTSVERPNTPAELTFALDNATEGFTKFPQNYAVEFAPYWMCKAPMSLTWQKDTTRNVEESLARTFSVSIATSKMNQDQQGAQKVAYGFRAFLLSGKMNPTAIRSIQSLEERLRDFSKTYTETLEIEQQNLESEFRRRWCEATEEERSKVLAWYNASRTELNKRRLEKLDDLERLKNDSEKEANFLAPQRVGLIVELAVAGAYRNDSLSANLRRSGQTFWITPAYITNDYSFVGVYRFQKDSADNRSVEYGMRFIYTKSRYSISLEYLKGEYKDTAALPNRERISILVEYVLSSNLWLSLSFGDDNKNPAGTGSLFSSLGIRYNFSGMRYPLSP